MSASSRFSVRSRDERGATLVLFVIFLPVLVLMLSFVLDVGNWFMHRRHLQMQADAAALAAARDLASPCSNGTVNDTAASYGGRDYNAQIENRQSAVHMVVNSRTYYNQTSPVDTTVDTNPPCTSLMVDVKLTETDVPWYFRVAHVPFINAHARVGLFTIDRYTGSLPLAVPTVEPKKVVARFVDEDTGTVMAETPLTRDTTTGGLTYWNNSAAPLPVTIDKPNIGVRIVVSGSNSTTCGDPLVECFDKGSANGLAYIRGWTRAGSGAQPNPPLARSVTLEAGTCPDAYFMQIASQCKIGVRATIDIGSLATNQAHITATAGGKDYSLSFDSGTGTWTTGAVIPVDPAAGPIPISLKWDERSGTVGTSTCTNGNNTPCKGSFGTVQRTFSATDPRSGPIQALQVLENSIPGANSLQRCSAVLTTCTHNLVVSVGLPPALDVAKNINDPLVRLRFSGGGSQSQGLDCDDNRSEQAATAAGWEDANPNAPGPLPNFSLFETELQWGCRPPYTQNGGTSACPANASALWGTPSPWSCVANQTGQYVNKIGKGLNARILCPKPDWGLPACADPLRPTSCTHPNNWSMFNSGLPADDTRIVQLFITPYGAFSGSGSYTVPIIRFATFYVTGWNGSGGGFPNPCQGNGDDTAADGEIVGHFIKYIDVLGSSTGTQICDMSAPDPCVPVMTR
jgi:Flp pilus assembly protein TadG